MEGGAAALVDGVDQRSRTQQGRPLDQSQAGSRMQGCHADDASRWARIGAAPQEKLEHGSGVLLGGGDKINDIEPSIVSASNVCSRIQEALHHRHMTPGRGHAQRGDATSGRQLRIHARVEKGPDEGQVTASHRDEKRRHASAVDDGRVDPERQSPICRLQMAMIGESMQQSGGPAGCAGQRICAIVAKQPNDPKVAGRGSGRM
ncbi:hypothetical protein BDW66DRAFT_145538 [Aspergillus desertorum]